MDGEHPSGVMEAGGWVRRLPRQHEWAHRPTRLLQSRFGGWLRRLVGHEVISSEPMTGNSANLKLLY